MSYFVCSQIEAPCQPQNQIAITELTLQDIAAIGVTPQSIGSSVTLGFALVFGLAMLGYALGIVIRLIRTI